MEPTDLNEQDIARFGAAMLGDSPNAEPLVNEARRGLTRLLPILSAIKGADILDVGAGHCILPAYLASKGFSVTALEPPDDGPDLSAMRQRVLENCARQGINLTLVRSPGKQLKLRGQFDLAYTNTLGHIRRPLRTLDRMYASLKRGGVLLANCPNFTIPYDTHIKIPLVPRSKRVNAFLYPSRIAAHRSRFEGLNFIRYIDLKRHMDQRGWDYSFRSAMRRSGLLRALPMRLQTPIELLVRKPAKASPKPVISSSTRTPAPDGLPDIIPINPKHQIEPDKIRYSAGGLITAHQADFLQDPDFKKAYAAGMRATGRKETNNNFAWRVYVCCWAAQHGAKLPGDFVECGVWTGCYSRALAEYIGLANRPDRKLYLFDTYEGIALELLSKEEQSQFARYQRKNNQLYADFYEHAKATFSHLPNATLIRGRVPDTLPSVPIETVAYLSIDMNNVYPEVEAIRYFWPKLTRGAVVVLDDYGFNGHEPQRHGIDALGKELGFQVLSMPTGQGLILKS